MIYLWPCTRREFVDYLSQRKPLKKTIVLEVESVPDLPINSENIQLVWQRSPADSFILPRAVIVADKTTNDFLAWVSTYFRNIRPFTAHCRVLTPSLARQAGRSTHFTSLPDLRSADIGLIFAEGIAYSVGKTDISKLPFSAFARTQSFAFGQAAHCYPQVFENDKATFQNIAQGWRATRELSNQPPLDLTPSLIENVWSALFQARAQGENPPSDLSSESTIVSALREVWSAGKVSDTTWLSLISIAGPGAQVIESIGMEGPRESRVLGFEKALKILIAGTDGTRVSRAFIAGYLASRIQPGSLEHFSLLFPAITVLPESFLWYGGCAGLSPETVVDNYGSGIGWLLKRELGRPSLWLDRPNADLSIEEMEILLRNRESRLSVRTLTSGNLKVEIFPLITTTVRWSEGEHDVESPGDKHPLQVGEQISKHQHSLFNEAVHSNADIDGLLQKIAVISRALEEIRDVVENKPGKSKRKKKL